MRLIAYDITNLTDARYFAARGAFMMGFSAAMSTIEEVNAMKEWVDIPAFFIHLEDEVSPEIVWEWQERTKINRFFVPFLTDHLANLFPNTTWLTKYEGEKSQNDIEAVFLLSGQLDHWNKQHEEISNHYQNIPGYLMFDNATSIELTDNEHIAGVAIKGSEEDKVGLKSFDKVDAFLDTIDIDY